MKADCHIHMVLDGVEWKAAMDRHRPMPHDTYIRSILARYQSLGYTYLRDGGDKLGASGVAKQLAPEYGITYRTPLAPLSLVGHYGGFIGLQYEGLVRYEELVLAQKAQGADFIKIMISGLMDFDRFGVLTGEEFPLPLIYPLVHIAHEEGLAVMAHCNGARAMETAADAGVDSIEHGAYADDAALCAMKENGTIWCPTLSTIANLLRPPCVKGGFPRQRGKCPQSGQKGRGPGRAVAEGDWGIDNPSDCPSGSHLPLHKGGFDLRHDPYVVKAILHSAMENVRRFAQMGGSVAPGTDAGAHNVPHGSQTEIPLLLNCSLTEAQISDSIQRLMALF